MEAKDNGKYALNPNTNRLILKTSPLYKRLVKLGDIEEKPFTPPKLILEKKVKAVANVNNLSKTEIDDLYHQLKQLREKKENVIQRRGRPVGHTRDPEKPKIKELMKPPPKTKPQFNIKIKEQKPVTDTEYEITELDV